MPDSAELREILDFIEEKKRAERPHKPSEIDDQEDNLTELDYCRNYSKTFSMGQD